MAVLIAAAMRRAVVRSGLRKPSRREFVLSNRNATSRSTVAPFAMRAAVGTPRVTEVAAPRAAIAPVVSAPWATPYTSPSAARRGVTSSVPPVRLVASPRAETATSIRLPLRAKAGRSAVTITAAMFLVESLATWSRVFTPSRSSIPISDSRVNTELSSLSPVLFSPTTRP